MDKIQRINAVFDYLRYKNIVKTQTDVAVALGSTQQNVSAALKGNERVLTDNFLMRVLCAYPDIFSTKWLMTGEGEMLLKTQSEPAQPARPYAIPADPAPMFVSDAPEPTLASIAAQLSALTAHIAALTHAIDARLYNIEKYIYTTPNVSPTETNENQETDKTSR